MNNIQFRICSNSNKIINNNHKGYNAVKFNFYINSSLPKVNE